MIDFEERRDELLEKIEEMTRRKQYKALRDILVELEPADIADLFDDLPEEMLPLLFRLLPKEPAAELFVELEPDVQEMLIRGFSNTELKEVLDELYLDDAVDIVEEMPAGVVKRILKHADPDTRKSINEILKYPEDTAGALMTTEFVDLKRDMTVEDAYKRIRRIGGGLEDINTLLTLSDTKGEIFQSNQTIRVCDQIANDVAVLFGQKYLGTVPNDASGRSSLWGDITKLIQQLDDIRAVENFDPEIVTCEQGDSKKAVLCIVNGLNVVNAMAQLYMSVIIQ